MNSSRYPRYNHYWKKEDYSKPRYQKLNIPLTQFLDENDTKSNIIEFSQVDLRKITMDNLAKSIDDIISSLSNEPKEKLLKILEESLKKETLIGLMKHGLKYFKSYPIIKLLLHLINLSEKYAKNVNCTNYDDLLIVFLSKIGENFIKFEDFLDSMVLITEYMTKNFIKSSSNETEGNNQNNKNVKRPDSPKRHFNSSIIKENENGSEDLTKKDIFENVIGYIYCSHRYDIFCLYPIFSSVLSILCKTNSYPECEIILNLLLLYKIDISTSALNSYIDFLCRNSMLDKCHDLLSELIIYTPEKKIPEDIMKYLIKKYGESHKEEMNQIIKKNVEKVKEKDNPIVNYNFKLNCEKNLVANGINIVSFGIYLKYLCKCDFLELAIFYYDELNKNNILKDEVIYNLLLNGCSKKLDIKNLHRIYMDMINKKIRPNIITFNTIIDAFIRNRNTEMAFKIFNQMTDNNIQPDNFTLSTLFKGINKIEHYKYLSQGVEMLNKKTYPIDIILINVLLDACIKLKDKKNFTEIFDNIINKKYNNVKPDLITYNTFIKGCSKFKLYEKAELAFNHLINNSSENKIFPNDVTFNSLIDVYVSQKNMDKVLQTVNLMQKYKIFPDNYTYTTIIKGLNKNSFTKTESNKQNANLTSEIFSNVELDLAFKLFNHVRQISKPDEILYNCIMDACLRFNKIDKMLEMYEEMVKNGINPSSITCGIVIKAYGMKGDLDSAMSIYYKMKKENIEISNITYGCIINACIKNNDQQKAFELYESLKKESYEMNTILYTTLIKAYTKQKDIDKVVEIFDTMKKSTNSKPNIITYNSIIDCCIKCNKFNLAYEYFKEMLYDIKNTNENSIRPDIVTFSTLIKGEINNKCFGNARKLMQKLLEYNYIKLDCVLLNTLLDGCDKCGCYEEAIDIFNIFKNRNVSCNMMTYSILMKICGKLNDFENSYKLLNEMKDNNISFNLIIITCFIKTCLNTNHVVEGINIFKDLPKYNISPDNIAYTTIISGIINNIQNCDYSDELINFVKKSIEDKAHLNKKLYFKCILYLNLLNHSDKAEALNDFLKEKNILTLYPNNQIIDVCDIYESKKENTSTEKKDKNSNSNSNDSNSSTNNNTLNTTVTNFNVPMLGYGYLNTINALNMCFYQKYFPGLKGSDTTCKKQTPLKEIYEKNKSYPFVLKNKDKNNLTEVKYPNSVNKENEKEDIKENTSDDKANSC